jgi:hypothetical protein
MKSENISDLMWGDSIFAGETSMIDASLQKFHLGSLTFRVLSFHFQWDQNYNITMMKIFLSEDYKSFGRLIFVFSLPSIFPQLQALSKQFRIVSDQGKFSL